jgi:hypothetical protein
MRRWGAQMLLYSEGARTFPDWSLGFERLGDGEGAFALDAETAKPSYAARLAK